MVGVVRSSHGDHVVVVDRRIEGRLLVVVACRAYDHRIAGRIGDSVTQHLRVHVATQAQIDHAGALVGRVDDALGNPRVRTLAGRIQHLHGHQPAVGADAGHAGAVVRRRGDDARYVRAVADVVLRVVVVVDEVPAVYVVHLAVAVVVVAIHCGVARIGPELAGKVGVVHVDAGIHHGDADHRAALRGVPGCGRTDPRQTPLVGVFGIVRGEGGMAQVVRLGDFYAGIGVQSGEDGRQVGVRRQAQAIPAVQADLLGAGFLPGCPLIPIRRLTHREERLHFHRARSGQTGEQDATGAGLSSGCWA